MLQIVMRFAIEKPRTTSPAYSTTWPTPPETPTWPIVPRMTSFAVTPGGSSPSNETRIVFGRCCARHCVASTCSTSDVPMPNASAPNAPCVEVWLSPQTIVIPGCETPSSGPITWTIPSRPLPVANSGTPKSSQLLPQRLELLLRERVGGAVDRLDVVVHRREREVGPAHAPAGEPEPLECLRRRDLVDQVQVDEQQGGLALGLGHEVPLPDLLEQRLAHTASSCSTPRPSRRRSPTTSPTTIRSSGHPLRDNERAAHT